MKNLRNIIGIILWGVCALLLGIGIPLFSMTIREMLQHIKYPYNDIELDDFARYGITIVVCGLARDAIIYLLLWQYINIL